MKKAWQTKRLGEVCEIIKGRKPMLKAAPSNGDLPYLIAKVMRGSAEAEYASVKDRNSVTVEESETIIICDGSNSGEVFTGFRGILSSTMGKIAKKAQIDDDYLRAFLASTFEVFNGAKTGAAIPHLDKEAMYQLQFPFPPLAEQQRIVGLLDAAFADLATAKANAEKNHQNARALFDSHLQSVFTQRGKGWVEKRLGDITEFKNGLNFTRRSNGQTLRIVGVGDFQDRSFVPIETLQSVTIDGELGDDYLIQRDDILTVRSNGSRDLVGRCMLVPDVDETTSFSGFIIRLRFDTRQISPRFLLHFMKSSVTRDRLTRDGGGANISNINQAKLSELPISLPSFKQQEEIASRLDDLREETQRLATLYERKLASLDALKKSLLQQAFTGNL